MPQIKNEEIVIKAFAFTESSLIIIKIADFIRSI